MKSVQVAIVDPALGKTGAHNAGFASFLMGQEAAACDLGFWCHQSISEEDSAALKKCNTTVSAVFSGNFYELFGKAGSVTTHWSWIVQLANQYRVALRQILERWPDRRVQVVYHTLSWEHASALVLAIKATGAPGARLQHFVFLMYSPGVDAVGAVWDVARSINFRISSNALTKMKNVRLYAGCYEYAYAYAHLLDLEAALPLHPCFLGDWSSPALERPKRRGNTYLLYVGVVKIEKGFFQLPILLNKLLKDATPADRFIIQFISLDAEPSRKILAVADTLNGLARKHPGVQVHDGFWPDAKLHQVMSETDVFYLTYDAAAYQHKTSGLLWLAAWHQVHAVVPQDSWLEREAKRLGMSYSTMNDDRVDPKNSSAKEVDAGYFQSIFTPFWPWLLAQRE